MYKSTVLFVVALLTLASVASATDGELEHRVFVAKTNYQSNPTDETLAALEEAVAALEASLGQSASQPEGSVAEIEPNDTSGTASGLGSIDYGQGAISPIGDVDWWVRGYAAQAGDLAFAYVDTTGSTSRDSQLNVYANDGTTLIEFDDDAGPSLSSCAAGGAVPQAGNVYYRINEYNNDAEIDPYLICAGTLGSAEAEVESNDTPGTANSYNFMVMNGNATGADIDYYSFPANAGDLLAVILDESPTGTAMDSDIYIYDTDGTTVLATGDNNSWNDNNCAGDATLAPTTGTYYVSVTNGGATGGDYRFVVCVHGQIPVELQSFSAE